MSPPARSLTLTVNGEARTASPSPGARLLHVLRNDMELNGPKFGCGLAQCGACTVLIDGVPARACVLPAEGLEGRAITTLEGLGTREAPHPLQAAFVANSGTQCGYCLNGMIMTLAALLEREPDADEAAIRAALRYNLCRCGSHVEVLAAATEAAATLKAESSR